MKIVLIGWFTQLSLKQVDTCWISLKSWYKCSFALISSQFTEVKFSSNLSDNYAVWHDFKLEGVTAEMWTIPLGKGLFSFVRNVWFLFFLHWNVVDIYWVWNVLDVKCTVQIVLPKTFQDIEYIVTLGSFLLSLPVNPLSFVSKVNCLCTLCYLSFSNNLIVWLFNSACYLDLYIFLFIPIIAFAE